VSELRLPANHRNPIDLTVGPDGNVWVTEPGTCCISGYLAVIAADGAITEFEVSGDPSAIMSFRGALWFTEPNNDLIGRMTTFGSVTFRDVPGRGNVPDGIATGPHGTVWFCENNEEIGVITLDRSS
jgi:virginiamycin B lyase